VSQSGATGAPPCRATTRLLGFHPCALALTSAAPQLLVAKKISGVPVVSEDGDVLGMISYAKKPRRAVALRRGRLTTANAGVTICSCWTSRRVIWTSRTAYFHPWGAAMPMEVRLSR